MKLNHSVIYLAIVALAALAFACGDDDDGGGGGGDDTGQADTGQADTGQADTGQVDTGQVDTGQVDTGQVDTGQDEPDGGSVCGDLTYEGECVGTTVRWCDTDPDTGDDVVVEFDCATQYFVDDSGAAIPGITGICTEISAAFGYYCAVSEGDPCLVGGYIEFCGAANEPGCEVDFSDFSSECVADSGGCTDADEGSCDTDVLTLLCAEGQPTLVDCTLVGDSCDAGVCEGVTEGNFCDDDPEDMTDSPSFVCADDLTCDIDNVECVSEAEGVLIISEVVEAGARGTAWVELTNVGDGEVSLSEYSLGVYQAGSTTLADVDSANTKQSLVLSGTLDACESFVVAFEDDDAAGDGVFNTVYGEDPDDLDFDAELTGEDVVALFLGPATDDGTDAELIDVYGIIGSVAGDWLFTDGHGTRMGTVTSPLVVQTGDDDCTTAFVGCGWDADEWDVIADDLFDADQDEMTTLLNTLTTPFLHTADTCP
jgi:hypothetical protein